VYNEESASNEQLKPQEKKDKMGIGVKRTKSLSFLMVYGNHSDHVDTAQSTL